MEITKKETVWHEPTFTWAQLKEKFPERLPHYKELEIVTIRIFIDGNYLPGKYTFNKHIPYQPNEKEKLLTDQELRMIIALKSMRIDLIVETIENVWVMEVAKNLKLSYTGKLLGYTHLYNRMFKPKKPLRMGVIAREEDVLSREALEAQGIKIWIV